MATPFRLKRSAVANKRPGLTDLQLGELALNTYDGRLFAERDTGGVGIGTTIALLTPFTENYGGGSIYYNDGSVGIGTTNPTGKFEVFGGRIVGAATSNVIPFLYSDYSDLPSASSYHGAFAHVHSAGKGFFAHAGNWIEIVSKETNGTVGSGTERYNVGPTDLTTLNVSGISTFAEQVSVGSSINVTGVVTASSFVGPLTGNVTGNVSGTAGGLTGTPNIEVGIATASSFVGPLTGNVTGNLTGNVTGNVSGTAGGLTGTPNIEVGIVTASSFVGTGVSVVGVVTATSYVGSGVALSGIVTSLVAGTNITLSGSTGQVTINSTGGGGTGGKFVSNNTGIHTLSNVGIGTTNASDDLTVRGDVAFTGRLKVTDLGLAGSNGQYLKSVGSGVTWASFPDARTSQTFTAIDGQTTFTFTYNTNFIDVYVNGVKLSTSEFTATNGTSVVLDEACFAGDVVELISFNTTATGGGGSGGISDVVQDATPQLGGNLDLNSNSITGTGNVSISGIVTATSFVGGLTGNSSSATQLQTSRNIGGVAFNGTSDINLPGVNQTGTQSINTSGIVTASSLVGTGVSVVGVVTATSFVGSGANLTGVLTPTGNGIGLSGIVTSIIAGTNVTISGATGAVTINASGGGGGGSIAGISTTGTSFFNIIDTPLPEHAIPVIGAGGTISHLSNFTYQNGTLSVQNTGSSGSGDLNVAGEVSSSTLSVSGNSILTGNVSVATGELTVGTSATITNAGVATFSGSVTASSFIGDGSALTGIAVTASSNVQVTWDVTSNGASAYRFTGPGNDGSDDNPDLYLVRGQRYRFTNNSGGSHPFQIRSSAGGSAYSTGVTNNGASSGNIDFNVQHDAPARLYYQCTSHSGMVGNIYITGGANWQTTDVNTSTAEEIFTLNNVGIGTDDPNGLLALTAASGRLLTLRNSTTGFASGDGSYLALNGSDLQIANAESANLILYTGDTERARIDSSGNLGLGESSSIDARLHVNSGTDNTTLFLESTDGDVNLGMADNAGSCRLLQAGGNLRFRTGGNANAFGTGDSERMVLDSAGNMGLGGITSPSFTTGGGIHLKRNYGIGFGDGSSGRPDFQIATPNGTTLDFRCGFGADTADIQMTTGGNLVFASGGGIDFSATGDGSGTAVSELLDDYEEGNFTPTVEWGGTSATLTGGTYGRYTKIGNTVIINFRIIQSARNATSGSFRMYGLPYNEGSSVNYNHGMVQIDSGGNMPSGAGSIMMYFNNNNVRFLYQTNSVHADLDASHCVDGTAWYGFATYFTS